MVALNFSTLDGTFIPDSTNRAWQDAHPGWMCPACSRSKFEIVRLTKAGKTYAKVVLHHCHISDLAHDIIQQYGLKPCFAERLSMLLERFKPTLICEDCNIADGYVKREI